VLLVRLGRHGVTLTNPLGLGAASLHPAFAFDDVQQLAARM